MTAKVTLGDVPLGTFSFSWSLTSGVNPETRIVNMASARAAKVMALGLGPHTLRIEKPGVQAEEFQGIYVLSLQPGDGPHTRGVLLADSRWLLGRKAVAKSYNVRRRTGRRVQIGDRPEATITQDDVFYARWSLNGGTKWEARRVLEDLLTFLVGPGNFVVPDLARARDIEDLQLFDNGDTALIRALQYLPGYDVFVDQANRLVVYDTLEVGADPTSRPAHVGTGDVVWIDKARLRPEEVDVYFSREVEVRFDFDEDNDGATTIVPDREPPLLQNVAPLSDFQLTVNGRTAAMGEWQIIGDVANSSGGLLQAYEDDTTSPRSALTVGSKLGPFNQARIRENYFPGLRSALTNYTLLANGAPDTVWVRRVSGIIQHWRRTFRILRQWVDKVRSIRAYRVGIVNTETGTRAPAQVFTNYVVRPSVKGLVRKESQRTDKGWEITGYAANLKDGTAGPFDVQVLDEDEGILSITPRPDPWGEAESVIAGTVSNFPIMDLKKINNPAKAAEYFAHWYLATLQSGWKLSTVLTVVQGSPNNLDRFHKRTVNIRELPEVGESFGPRASILIGPGVMTAMFAWDDTWAEQVKDAFLTGLSDVPEQLLVNREHVDEVAKAAARRLYSLLADRWEGSFRGPLNTAAVPSGSMKTVTHQVQSAGPGQAVVGTLYQCPPILSPPDIEAYLPDSIRKVVYRRAQP